MIFRNLVWLSIFVLGTKILTNNAKPTNQENVIISAKSSEETSSDAPADISKYRANELKVLQNDTGHEHMYLTGNRTARLKINNIQNKIEKPILDVRNSSLNIELVKKLQNATKSLSSIIQSINPDQKKRSHTFSKTLGTMSSIIIPGNSRNENLNYRSIKDIKLQSYNDQMEPFIQNYNWYINELEKSEEHVKDKFTNYNDMIGRKRVVSDNGTSIGTSGQETLFLRYVPVLTNSENSFPILINHSVSDKNPLVNGNNTHTNKYIVSILEKLKDNDFRYIEKFHSNSYNTSNIDSDVKKLVQNVQNPDFNTPQRNQNPNIVYLQKPESNGDILQPVRQHETKETVWVNMPQSASQDIQFPVVTRENLKGPFSIVPSLINRLPFISSYYPPFFGWFLNQAFGAIPGPSIPSLPFSPFRQDYRQASQMTPWQMDPYQYRQWSSPFSSYFPIVINDPFQTFYTYLSNIVEYGPSADVCHRYGNWQPPSTLNNFNSLNYEKVSKFPENLQYRTVTDDVQSYLSGENNNYNFRRLKRNADTKALKEFVQIVEENNYPVSEDNANQGKRRYDQDAGDEYIEESYKIPSGNRRQGRPLKHKLDKKWYDNNFRKTDSLWESSKDINVRSANEDNIFRRPDIGPQITKLIVRKGGVAIAGAGGIATAGSGGTAIVGPGGTAYTTPASSGGIAMVGPGGKVVGVPELTSVMYGRTSSIPITATGAGHNTISNSDGSVFTTSDNAGGIALVGSTGNIIGVRDSVEKDGIEENTLNLSQTKELNLPPGARLLTTGPIIYYNPVYPNMN